MKKTKLLDDFEQNLEDRMDDSLSVEGPERLTIEEKMKLIGESDSNKQSITIRLDKDLLDAIKKEAISKKIGYQTLMSIELRNRFIEQKRSKNKTVARMIVVPERSATVEVNPLYSTSEKKELLNQILAKNQAVLNEIKKLSKEIKSDPKRKIIRKTVHHKVKAKGK